MLLPRHLVHADVEQVVEPARVELVGHDPVADRPTVSQSMPTRSHSAVLSILVADHATSRSKSRVNRDPGRANGTPSTRTPCSG